MLETGTWDIRCPPELKTMFPHPRRGWWYKVNREQARSVVAFLSIEYGVPIPHIDDERPPERWRGAYYFGHQLIRVHARAHLKSVFHEFYHHLDEMTNGRYDSSDEVELAWQFADRMFAAMR